MPRLFTRPLSLVSILLLATAIPIIFAGVRMYEISAGQLPDDAAKFDAVPWAIFLHGLGGLLFGLLGPLQFAGVLKRRFGRLHRITGRIFVVSGLFLGLSSLRLLAEFPDTSTWVLVSVRLAAGLGLSIALLLALAAIRQGNVPRHRAWMIRAYAIGMGQSAISFIMLPIFLITGEPVEGYVADLLVAASWAFTIGIAEWVIRRPTPDVVRRPRKSEPPLPRLPQPTSLR